jgi:long-subunit acyl-CoA synthetase (AMP-forming)
MLRYFKTLNDVQKYYCKIFKHNTFIIEKNKSISYGEFDQLVTKIEKITIPISPAKYDILTELNRPFPIIQLIGKKSIFWSASLFALIEKGFTVIPSHDMKDIDQDKNIPKIVIDDQNQTFVDIIPPDYGIGLYENNDFYTSYAVILKTSGSNITKHVPLTHENILSVVRCMQPHANNYNVNEKDRFFSILPWSHSYGLTCELFFSMTRGCSIHLDDGIDTFTNMRNSNSTLFCVVPKVIEKIKKNIESFDTYKLLPACIIKRIINKNFRLMVCAGSYLSQENVSFIENRMNLPLLQGYGLTETSPLVLLDGLPIDCNIVKIDKEKNNELLVSGSNLFHGYIHLETKKIDYHINSFFRTGDSATFDENTKKYTITGRISSNYKLSNGRFINPTLIEEKIKSLDDKIEEVFIFPDENYQYNICLLYIYPYPHEPYEYSRKEPYRDFLEQHLKKYEMPDKIYLLTKPFPSFLYTLKKELKRKKTSEYMTKLIKEHVKYSF